MLAIPSTSHCNAEAPLELIYHSFCVVTKLILSSITDYFYCFIYAAPLLWQLVAHAIMGFPQVPLGPVRLGRGWVWVHLLTRRKWPSPSRKSNVRSIAWCRLIHRHKAAYLWHHSTYFVLFHRSEYCLSVAMPPKDEKRKQVHEAFDEKDEVLSIIDSLKDVHKDMIKFERAIERFTGQYQIYVWF